MSKNSYTLFLIHGVSLAKDSSKQSLYKNLIQVNTSAGIVDGKIMAVGDGEFPKDLNYGDNFAGCKVLIKHKKNSFLKRWNTFLKYFKFEFIGILYWFIEDLTKAEEFIKKEGIPTRIVALSSYATSGILGWFIKQKYGVELIVFEQRSEYGRDLFNKSVNKSYSYEAFKDLVISFLNKIGFSKFSRRNTKNRIRKDWHLANLIFNDIDRLIAISDNQAKDIIRTFPSIKDRLKMIPNPVSLKEIDSDKKFQIKLEEFKGNRIMLGGWANWTRELKRPDLLINALHLASKVNPNICLVLAGPTNDNLKQIVQRASLEKKILLPGSLSKEGIKALAQVCDCCVVSSIYETFSLPIVEAMSVGKPSIATKCGGPEMIIEKPYLGYLVDKNDADEFSKAILKFISNKDTHNGKIKQFWESHYSLNAISCHWKNIYNLDT